MTEGLNVEAKARVKLTKLDEHGNKIGYEEHEVSLNKEEAMELWRLHQQD